MIRLFLLVFLCSLFLVSAQDDRPPRGDGDRTDNNRSTTENRVSPARRIERRQRPDRNDRPPELSEPGFRAIDGTGNNTADPSIGAAGSPLIRLVPPAYGDGVSTPAGGDRPSARAISNAVCAQSESRPNQLGVSDYFWQWGQFLDHDIDLTDGTDPPEPMPIAVPSGDPWFDPQGTGTQTIELNRSIYDPESGTSPDNPRQQISEITAWIDASNVYGSDLERADALRTRDGTGRLKTSEGGMPPFNTDGLPNAGGSFDTLYLAGDVRANEQVGLLALHALFIREHNRLAKQLTDRNPEWDGDQIYQKARQLVGAQMQVITYREFLPVLLGRRDLSRSSAYRAELDASIANAFSTGAYRFGHSAVNATLLRLDADGNEIDAGHLSLRNAFFAPQRLAETGLEPVLRGLAAQPCQTVDPLIIDDLRNFLFGPPGSGGFDLASLNLQRGRDHGLPTYNDMRRAMGMPPVRRFDDITDDPEMRRRLAEAYDSVEDIDLWVGCLAEDPMPGAMVGPLAAEVIGDQFRALRDGDRFWYTRVLSDREIRDVERTTLADIIRRNTEIDAEIDDDVFHVPAD